MSNIDNNVGVDITYGEDTITYKTTTVLYLSAEVFTVTETLELVLNNGFHEFVTLKND